MIKFSILFISLIIYLLFVVYKITNEPLKEKQNKEEYEILYRKIHAKMSQVKDTIDEYYKKDVVKADELNQKYKEFFYKYLGNIVTTNLLNRDYDRDGKTDYPIKNMRIALNKFTTEFPDVFKIENRDRKLNLILNG
jgi:hypothetical protein